MGTSGISVNTGKNIQNIEKTKNDEVVNLTMKEVNNVQKTIDDKKNNIIDNMIIQDKRIHRLVDLILQIK